MLSKNFDLYSSQYEYNIIIGYFNVRVSDPYMNNFCNANILITLIKVSNVKHSKTWKFRHALTLFYQVQLIAFKVLVWWRQVCLTFTGWFLPS